MTAAANTRRILITRPQPAADDFAAKLRREGFEVFVAPMTEYVEMNSDIGDIAPYQGLIFTSAQAVNIFVKRFNERYIPVFCVGDATAQTAEKHGFRRIYSAQGDAHMLLGTIRQRKDHHELKRMLHVCGEDTAEDFVESLKGDGIYVDRAPVYKAEYIDHLPPPIIKALQEGDITTVTLFSARTAGNFARILGNEADLKGISADLEAVCLSDRVAAEVKVLPWRAVRVAPQPQMDTVMDILREKEEGRSSFAAMAADPVIEAFGGLRPLAHKLDITPSTVQGWKKRGVIPETRVDAVLKAALDAGISHDLLWKEDKGKNVMTDSSDDKKDGKAGGTGGSGDKAGAPPQAAKSESERRRGADRREKYTAPDARGNISHEKYAGPDRRTGLDRRSYQERQAGRIAAERWKFFNRTTLMAGFFTACVLYAGAVLLAPEMMELNKKGDDVAAMQSQVDQLNARILELQKQQQGEILGLENKMTGQMEQREASFGQKLYERMGEIEAATQRVSELASTVTGTAGTVAGKVGDAAVAAANTTEVGRDLTSFIRVLTNLSAMGKTKDGQGSIGRAFVKLREVLAMAPRDTAGLNAAIDNALKTDPDLKKLLGNIDARDLGAAALLLALNEFRGNISTNNSFEQDLLIMQKFLGDDPKMQKALTRLTPYAKSGVLNRRQLQQEFGGLASDIVMSKLQGQDLSVKQEMLKRLSKLVKVRKIDDIEGTTVDARVARAQLLLNKGDVKGAMRELQQLEGAPAKTAAPFMEQAAGNVMAEDASEQMLQNVMKQFTPGNLAADGATLEQVFEDIWNQGPTGLMPYIAGGARNPNAVAPDTAPDMMMGTDGMNLYGTGGGPAIYGGDGGSGVGVPGD